MPSSRRNSRSNWPAACRPLRSACGGARRRSSSSNWTILPFSRARSARRRAGGDLFADHDRWPAQGHDHGRQVRPVASARTAKISKAIRPAATPRYLSDFYGAFEVAARQGGGKCLKQVITRRGIAWCGDADPLTVLGSRQWRDCEIACDICCDFHQSASLFGRIATIPEGQPPRGYQLRIQGDGGVASSGGRQEVVGRQNPVRTRVLASLRSAHDRRPAGGVRGRQGKRQRRRQDLRPRVGRHRFLMGSGAFR